MPHFSGQSPTLPWRFISQHTRTHSVSHSNSLSDASQSTLLRFCLTRMHVFYTDAFFCTLSLLPRTLFYFKCFFTRGNSQPFPLAPNEAKYNCVTSWETAVTSWTWWIWMLFMSQKDMQILSSMACSHIQTHFIPHERTEWSMNHILSHHMHYHTQILSFWVMIHPSIYLSSREKKRATRGKSRNLICLCVSALPEICWVCVCMCSWLLSAIAVWHHSTICLSVGPRWCVPLLEARLTKLNTMTALCSGNMHAARYMLHELQPRGTWKFLPLTNRGGTESISCLQI